MPQHSNQLIDNAQSSASTLQEQLMKLLQGQGGSQQPTAPLSSGNFQQPSSITIPQGATLSGLAQQHGTTVQQLLQLNPQITNPNLIFAGAKLNIPQSQQLSTTQPNALANPQQAFFDQIKQTLASIADQANQFGQQFQESLPAEVPERESAKLIRDFMQNRPQAPEAPNLSQLFLQERQRLGLEPLETRLAEIDSQIERVQTASMVDQDRAGERPVSMRQISGQRSAIQREAQREMAFLQIERSAVARQVDNKLSALNIVMDMTQKDFQNSSQLYNQEFSRAMQMIDLFVGMEDREIRAEERAEDRRIRAEEREEDRESQAAAALRKNATAQLTTITNLLKDNGKSFADLNADQLREVRQWEMEAGFGAGFHENIFNQATPNESVLSTTTKTVGGQKFGQTLLRDKNTGEIRVITTPMGSVSGGGEEQVFDIKNIPGELRTEIAQNVRSGADLAQLIEFYPDVQFDALKSIFEQVR